MLPLITIPFAPSIVKSVRIYLYNEYLYLRNFKVYNF